MKDFKDVSGSAGDMYTVETVGGNILNWRVVMKGPDDSVYKGGRFVFDIVLPEDFPFKPPKVTCATKIFHPRITADKGEMCFPIVDPKNWQATNRMSEVIKGLRSLLIDPSSDSPLNEEAGKLFQTDPTKFAAVCADYVAKYAH